MKNNTFISCIDRGEAERAGQVAGVGNGFDFLEKVKQNRWSYLNFIFYLKRKEPTDYTGPEAKISALLDDENVSWMPLTVCGMMGDEGGEGEPEITKFEEEMRRRTRMLEEKLAENTLELTALHETVKLQFGGDEEVKGKQRAARLLRRKTLTQSNLE